MKNEKPNSRGNLPNDSRNKLGITDPWVAATSIALGYPKGKIDRVVARDNVPVEWIE